MAAFKEATVIVLDVGSNMDEPAEEGMKITALEVSIQCVTRMLQNKLFTESKDEFALVLLGAEDTDNRLNELSEESYNNITTDSGLKLVDWAILDRISSIKATDVQGDVFEALKVAVDVIEQEEAASKKKRFGKRRILLFSNLHGLLSASASQTTAFAKNAHTCGINMIQLIGVDLEEAVDADSSHSKRAKKNKATSPVSFMTTLFQNLESLADEKTLETVESYSFRDAVKYSNYFASRQVRPTPWNGVLELGNSLKVPVVMYARVKEAKPKQTWKTSYAADPSVAIQKSTQFFVQRGLQRDEVAPEDIVEAFRYGTTLVPFSEEDKAEMAFTSIGKCLKVLGFALASHVKSHLYVGDDVRILTGPMTDTAALTAISALARGLTEEKMVIICKYGYNARSAPRMICLSPHLCQREAGPYDGFFVHYLPFEDDLRLYTFANLLDEKAKPLFQPNDEQLEAVGDLIDQLTVTPEDEYFEQLNPKNVRNPYLQRLYHSLQHRALHPDDPLPPVDESLLASLSMPPELVKRSEEARNRIQLLFPMKKMEKKKFHKNISGTDGVAATGAVGEEQMDAKISSDIAGAEDAVSTISTISPTEDFIAMTEAADEPKFSDAVHKAIDVIQQLVFSFDGEVYADKISRLISVMRERCVSRQVPQIFNTFLKTFKAELLERKLNFVWKTLVERKLTLIHGEETKESTVTAGEANDFLHTTKVEVTPRKTNGAKKKEEDDMFDEMFE